MARRIVYVQYTNPAAYPPLEHSSRILANRGWEVLFVGMEGKEVRSFRLPEHPRVRVRLMPYCPPGWRQKLHYARFAAAALGRIVTERPDWVYASDLWAAPIASVAARLGFRVLYHEHDWIGPAVGGPASAAAALAQAARRDLAWRARVCVLPNEERADAFSRLGGGRDVLTVWNCPRLEEVAPEREPARDEFRLIYYGSIVPQRLPSAVLDALALLPGKVRLTIIGYATIGYPNYPAELRHRADALGLGARVRFLGSLPTRQELLAHCRNSHLGLALMPRAGADDNERTMAGASNKAFDYLAAGIPVLLSDLPAWRRMFGDAGYGRACDPDDPRSIAAAVAELVRDPIGTQQAGESGRQRILDEWNYERQFEPVLAQLEQRAIRAHEAGAFTAATP